MESTAQHIARKFITPARTHKRDRAALPVADFEGVHLFESIPIHMAEWGTGPRILLIHGWEGAMQDMAGFVAPLIKSGFSVLALDLPAHGASGGDTATIPQLARCVSEVAAKYGSVDGIIAHSVGCAVSSLAVARGLDVQHLVCIASPLRYRHYVETIADQHGLPAPMRQAIFEELDRLGTETDAVDYAKYGPDIGAQSLFLHSADDKIVPALAGQTAATLVPGARYEQVDGLGHARILADPDVIRRAIDHVSGVSSAANAV